MSGQGEAEKWYPVTASLSHQLVTDSEPVEFVTELTMPFTLDIVRNFTDPLALAARLAPGKYMRWEAII